ncbi:hypothetical protein A7K91_24050 [Paenibacillus oryzae]|uniref:DUF4064 domain-containing protein n=1 Tax=Paenibacillus oryzae TaxID=1844972 RepID=A0A1A5YL12_9BACL|nr:phage holin family protein [Paenibacillus oryzae]OBR66306.1 hypothetical protein A7K91_24050 [Paenibacillus oryzae]
MENNENQFPSNNQGFSPVQPVGFDQPLKHSGLGITSFVIAIVSVLLIIIGSLIISSSVSNFTNNEDLLNEMFSMTEQYQDQTELGNKILENEEFKGAVTSMLGAMVLFVGAVGLAFLGLIFGLIAVFAKNKRKVFGIIGLILNGLVFVGAIGLFIIGLAGMAAAS